MVKFLPKAILQIVRWLLNSYRMLYHRGHFYPTVSFSEKTEKPVKIFAVLRFELFHFFVINHITRGERIVTPFLSTYLLFYIGYMVTGLATPL